MYLPFILVAVGGDDSVVFPDSVADTIKTPSPQPKSDSSHVDSKAKEAKPRYGFDTGGVSSNFDFGIRPNAGGISGSASFSSSYGGQGQSQGLSGSQSQSFNFQAGSNGFSTSNAASQASSFNSQFPGSYGYEVGKSDIKKEPVASYFSCQYTPRGVEKAVERMMWQPRAAESKGRQNEYF
jgi:hypothetical protein